MPSYDYFCKACDNRFEQSHRIAEREKPKSEPCPSCGAVESVELGFFEAPGLGDPVRLGLRKPDNGFKEVLSKIHEKTPGSNLNLSSSHL